MAMGIPVITNSGVGDVKEIVEKYKAGYVLDEFTETAMQKAVQDICSNRIDFDPAGIRKGALDFYNLEATLNTYSKVYKAVIE